MTPTNNADVVYRFARREAGRNSTGSLFSPDGTWLFSYGDHFPLARFEGGRLIVNDARASVTTSCQQTMLRAELVRSGWRPTDERETLPGYDRLSGLGAAGYVDFPATVWERVPRRQS